MKYLFILISTLFISQNSYSQCNKPSRYEDTKYDKYYGWDKFKPTKEDSNVILKYQAEISKLHCQLRTQNLTRCFLTSLPQELQTNSYVRSLAVRENNGKLTVPAFKLVMGGEVTTSIKPVVNTQTTYNDRRQANVTRLNTILAQPIKSNEELSEEVKSFTNVVDQPVTASQFYEDPYKELTYLTATKNVEGYFGDCLFDPYFGIGRASENRIEEAFDENTFEITVYVNKDGYVDFVAGKFNTNAESNVYCQQESLKKWARILIESYDFKPAIKNNTPVDSYVTVKFNFGFPNKTDKYKTKRKN